MSDGRYWGLFVMSVVLGLVGDAAIKRAGVSAVIDWRWFAAGFIAYAMTSCGWLFLLRARKLSIVGTMYPVMTGIGLVVIGAVFFGERLGLRGWCGVLLGLASVVLLALDGV